MGPAKDKPPHRTTMVLACGSPANIAPAFPRQDPAQMLPWKLACGLVDVGKRCKSEVFR